MTEKELLVNCGRFVAVLILYEMYAFMPSPCFTGSLTLTWMYASSPAEPLPPLGPPPLPLALIILDKDVAKRSTPLLRLPLPLLLLPLAPNAAHASPPDRLA